MKKIRNRSTTEKRGFAARPCLLGRSRGGLWVTSWAAENPEKVAGIAGIYASYELNVAAGAAVALALCAAAAIGALMPRRAPGRAPARATSHRPRSSPR